MKKITLILAIVALMGSCKKQTTPVPATQSPVINTYVAEFNWSSNFGWCQYTKNGVQLQFGTTSVKTGDVLYLSVSAGFPTTLNGSIKIDGVTKKEVTAFDDNISMTYTVQ